jgi:hypothetical protein
MGVVSSDSECGLQQHQQNAYLAGSIHDSALPHQLIR